MSTHNIKCLARAGQTTCAVLRPFLKKTSPPQTHQQTCCARQRWRNDRAQSTDPLLPRSEKKRKETPHRHYERGAYLCRVSYDLRRFCWNRHHSGATMSRGTSRFWNQGSLLMGSCARSSEFPSHPLTPERK